MGLGIVLALGREDALFIIDMDAGTGGGIVLLIPIVGGREGLADAMLGRAGLLVDRFDK